MHFLYLFKFSLKIKKKNKKKYSIPKVNDDKFGHLLAISCKTFGVIKSIDSSQIRKSIKKLLNNCKNKSKFVTLNN